MSTKKSKVGRPRVRTSTTDETHPALLVSRREGRRLLGNISETMVIRLEKLGVLDPVKPSGSPNGKTFYRLSNVTAVAKGGDDVSQA
jgi:hypothetical protein